MFRHLRQENGMNFKRMGLIALASLALLASLTFGQSVAAEKKHDKRANHTAEQRKKIFEAGVMLCRKKYGGLYDHVEVDYYHVRYVCWIH
jgi:hypothetical protein